MAYLGGKGLKKGKSIPKGSIRNMETAPSIPSGTPRNPYNAPGTGARSTTRGTGRKNQKSGLV